MNFVIPSDHLDKQDCPLVVLKCSDWRFRIADQEFVEKGLGYKDFDLFSWPDGGKEILKQNGFKTAVVEKIISFSRGKHNIKKLLLIWHIEDLAEEQKLVQDLQAAKEILAKELPTDLEIILTYSKNTPHGLEYVTLE